MLVRTGYGADEETRPPAGVAADAVVDNLAAAASWILRSESEICNLNRICNPPMLIARSVHPLPGEAERKERLLALVDGFSSRRVLVVGDLIADEFIYGEVARVSREAPVLILKYDATEMVAGGAGNAANNVAALGGRARARRAWSAPTPKAAGCWRAFTAASIARQIVRARELPHAGQDAHSRRRRPLRRKQQVVRIDREAGWPLAEAVSRGVREEARRPALDGCDAVLLSDYGSGLVTPALAATIRRGAGAALARRRPIPVLVDTRYRLLDYRGLDGLHAERVRSRAGARRADRRRRGRARTGGPRCCCRRTRHAGGAHHARQPRHGAVRAAGSRPCTCRSSAPTR